MARDALRNLPVLDLTPLIANDTAGIAQLAVEVDECLKEFGFLVVVGHGVPDELRQRARTLARQFFHQDEAAKESVLVDDRRGWVPSGYEATAYAGDTVAEPDLKESFTMGPEPECTGSDGTGPDGVAANGSDAIGAGLIFRPNRWDTGIDGFREVMIAYLDEMLRVGHDLLRLFEVALGVAPGRLTDLANDPDCVFNLNWYPSFERTGPAAPGQFRIGPHSDYGCCTILDRQSGVGGLQIRSLEGDWFDPPVVPGSYTINVADLLARLTGDRWRSTPHRVLPPSRDAPTEELLSLVYFHEFDASARIETLPPPSGGGAMYEPVIADDYISAKFDAVTLSPST
jgi:isopenicillin N synthase-like dioxygenase